jgi:hypothetical protein
MTDTSTDFYRQEADLMEGEDQSLANRYLPSSPSFPEHETWGQPSLGQYHLIVEGNVIRGELKQERPTQPGILSQIRARQSQVIQRALEIQKEYGDPIRHLGELLGRIQLSQDEWEALVEEPY